ncbi:MAG: serine hydrolase domain-containing protein [Ruminococcus sp.]|nr:serine hydrolase domain-containing protein [Ruminococcus sp.]
MKKVLAIALCCAMVFSVSACSSDSSNNTETTVSSTSANTDTTSNTEATISTEEIKTHIENAIKKNKFEGIVYLTKNGSVVYESATGKDEKENDLTVGSNMYIGSLSKQFCATAIMMLKEQGKLSVDDTLDKYFPEYQYGEKITIKNLLTMRSGIVNTTPETTFLNDISDEITVKTITDCVFKQPLNFEPDTSFEYSNSNYFLLACIVEQVSGQNYNDFLRKNIFEPLEMTNTGFVSEVKDNPKWADGFDFNKINFGELLEKFSDDKKILLLKGAGDISSNAYDMDKWMRCLVSGKVISKDSYKEMSQNYTTEQAMQYGYGLIKMYNGVGHTGSVFTYTSLNYINENQGYNLFIINNVNYQKLMQLTTDIIYGFIL